MKNVVIFPKDWVQLHPYHQTKPSDAYYTNLANRIYQLLKETELIYSFENDESKQIAMRLAAYFEDVISGLNIWRSFILYYKEHYGRHLPFHSTGDDYYDDEVNLEDVRFLLWHYTQHYHGQRKSTFVNPDNPGITETARLIYDLFCEEWTTAPENEDMQRLFSSELRYETEDDYCELLFWFHHTCYLFPDATEELTEMVKDFLQMNPDADPTTTIMTLHETMAYVGKTLFVGLTSPGWLLRLIPAGHPDYALFQEREKFARSQWEAFQEDKKNTEANRSEYKQFVRAANGRLFIYFEKKRDLKDFLGQCEGLKPKRIADLYHSAPNSKFAAYAMPKQGILLLTNDVACIKDKHNPFYDREEAEKNALSFFIVPHVGIYLLKQMMEKGMLNDAQTASLVSPERGKAIIQENWEFLCGYFLKQSVFDLPLEADMPGEEGELLAKS